MSVCHHIEQLAVQEFFPKRSGFPGKRQKLDFFCLHRVTNTHQNKIASSKISQIVAEWLSLDVSVLL